MKKRVMLEQRKRMRINPAVAITAIISLVVLSVSLQIHYPRSDAGVWIKWVAVTVIAFIVGVKIRMRGPLYLT